MIRRIGLDGWPVDQRAALVEAMRKIRGADLAEANLPALADMILAAQADGRDDEQPRNRPSATGAAENELEKLHDLARRLAEHIETMRAPAISAVAAEGVILSQTANDLRGVAEAARDAMSHVSGQSGATGRPPKAEAAAVTASAADAYQRISARRPTFTTDPQNSAVSGDWPSFLGEVFKTLGIVASVASQVRPPEKTPPKKG